MKKLLFIITLIITTISAQMLENSVPMNLSFQGVLSSSDGTIYEDGEYELTFRIMFPSLQGVDINIWEETQSVFVANGLFSTILGSVEELPAIIPGNAELEVQVGEEVLTPRTTFTSVPFSIASNFAAISGRAQVADSSMHTMHAQYADSTIFAFQSQHAIYSDTAMVAMSAPMAGSAMYAGYSDTSGFSYQSTHSTYSDSSMYSGSAGHAIHANYATYSDSSVYSYNSMVSVYADTAVFVGESIHSIYSDSSFVSMNAMSSVYADTSYYVVGYTPTSELGVVALSNDFNDLLNIPDYVSQGDITGITTEQAAAIELNTAKIGITADQASAIVANTAKVSGATNINGLSDTYIEGFSMYLGNNPSNTTDNANGNISVGTTALSSITTGDWNTAIGKNSLMNNTSGESNTAVGSVTLEDNTTGYSNTAIGDAAMKNNTTGASNIAIGRWSGDEITTGNKNSMLGYGTDPSTVDGTNQTAIGYKATGQADNSVTLGNDDVTTIYMAEDAGATVYAAGLNLGGTAVTATAEELNLLDGVTSLTSGATSINGLSDGLVEGNSIYLGNDPSSTTDNSQYNVSVGISALNSITTGQKNVAVGYKALNANTTGYSNTAVGLQALDDNTTGVQNTALGAGTLRYNTTGNRNSALGAGTLWQNTIGEYNTAAGYDALKYNTTGSSNTATGANSLFTNTTGDYNTAVGSSSLMSNSTGVENTAFGYNSLKSNSTVNGNSAFGAYSLESNTTGGGNSAFGQRALYKNQDGHQNIAYGAHSLENTLAGYNVALGFFAGNKNTTGTGNIFIGNNAGNNDSHQTAHNKLIVANSDTEIPLIEGDFSAKTLKVNGSIEANSFMHSIAGLIDGSSGESYNFNGSESIIPVRTANGNFDIYIDSDQVVSGRVLTFKQVAGEGGECRIRSEGNAKFQYREEGLAESIALGGGSFHFESITFFSDGENWYSID